MDTYGLISLVPVAVVIIFAVWTKRCAESLFLGAAVAAVILAVNEHPGSWTAWWTTTEPWAWADGTGLFDTIINVVGGNVYYIIMFGMFGALIRLLDQSGAALGFADVGAKVANSRKKTMVTTWVLGILIFIEDYLNALGVGVAMKSLSDKHKISREMLAWIVNTTGAAVCILVPISSWGVLYSSQIAKTGLFNSSGVAAYASAIPYMLYSWVAVIFVILVIFKVVPLFGPMKKAEARALETGKTFPEWYYEDQGENTGVVEKDPPKSGWWNFVAPMIVMVIIAIWTEDLVLAVIISVVIGGVMLMLQKKLTIGKFLDQILGGFGDMLYVTVLVLMAFVLQAFNDQLGLTKFVIDSVAPIMSPAVFPMIAFVVVAALSFCTGSFWGVAAISFPIILPVADSMHVNLSLAVGAVAAATAFGSHACFYSDAVTVTAAATGIKNIDYAKTALPLIAVPFVVSIVLYGIVGFVMA